MRDPILDLIPPRLREKPWLTFIVMSGVYTLVMLFFDWSVSTYYLHKGMTFCSLYEWRELITSIIVFGIVIPTFWVTFTWQPQAISRLFEHFLKEEVIQADKEEIKEFLLQNLYAPANRKQNLYMVIGGVLLSLLLFIVSVPQDDPFLWGYPTVWWRLNRVVFFVWLFNGALFMYPIWWVVIRDFYFLRALHLFYRRFKLRPRILHPDGCNGLCEVGVYAMKITFIVIVIGGWISYLIIFPFWAGKDGWNTNNFGPDTVAMMVGYLIVAPLSFWWPIWETHKAMVVAKNEKLQEVANQIRQIISDTTVTPQTQEKLQVLYDRYSFLKENCRTWPLKTSLMGRFSLSMLFPLFSTLLSVWMEWRYP